MVKKILGNVLILIGLILIVASGVIYIYDEKFEKVAQDASHHALEEMKTHISDSIYREDEIHQINIDDHLYCGFLTISILDLQLPIQSFWSDEKLLISPCIYMEEPLIIAAHNSKAHFANLYTLQYGDEAVITDLSGKETRYKVVEMIKVHESELDKLIDTKHDLTIFTCNKYNITERIVVRFEEIITMVE